MEIAIRLFLGSAGGALLGLLIGRARLCSGKACAAKGSMIYSIVAGAAFGAAVAWYVMNR